MKNRLLIAIGLCFLMTSCVYSLFPIYTDDTLIFKKELLGTWGNDDVQVTFEPIEGVEKNGNQEEKGYILKIQETDRIKNIVSNYTYDAHVVQINKELYIDLYPSSEDDYIKEHPMPLAMNLLPVHTFFKLEIKGEELKFIHFNLNKLNELFRQKKIHLRHEIVNDEVLITAQPKEIQKFLEKYATDPNVFDEEETYYRL